jgi:hypothetical protein
LGKKTDSAIGVVNGKKKRRKKLVSNLEAKYFTVKSEIIIIIIIIKYLLDLIHKAIKIKIPTTLISLQLSLSSKRG